MGIIVILFFILINLYGQEVNDLQTHKKRHYEDLIDQTFAKLENGPWLQAIKIRLDNAKNLAHTIEIIRDVWTRFTPPYANDITLYKTQAGNYIQRLLDQRKRPISELNRALNVAGQYGFDAILQHLLSQGAQADKSNVIMAIRGFQGCVECAHFDDKKFYND